MLKMAGYVSARLSIPVTDPRFKELVQNEELLLYQFYWLQRKEEDMFKMLGKHLGSFWEYADVHSPKDSSSNPHPDKMFYPLALSLNSDLLDHVKKKLHPPKDSKDFDPTAQKIELSEALGSAEARALFRSYISKKDKEVFGES